MTRITGFLSLAALSLLSVHARAQLEPGLKVGAKVEGFKAHAMTGDQAGKLVDFVAERKDRSTVFVFVRAKEFDRPMARFLKKLDEAFTNGVEGVDDPMTVAVWMAEDRDKSKEYLPRAQESIKFSRTPLAVFDGDAEGPPAWDLNAGARLSAVVVRNGKVAGTFGYRSLNETDAEALLKTIKAK